MAAIGFVGCSKKEEGEKKTASATPAAGQATPKAGGEGAAAGPKKPAPPKIPAPPFDPANLKPVAMGSASIDFLQDSYEAPAGFYTTGRHGDYVLRNERVSLIFGAIRKSDAPPEPAKARARKTHPGALLDAMIDESRVDFINEFTQGTGTELDGPVIEYDYAEFIKTGDQENQAGTAASTHKQAPAVGLKLSGQLPDGGGRIETIYWLTPGESRVRVQSTLIGLDAPIAIADAVDWGAGTIISERHGTSPATPTPIDGIQWYVAHAGHMAVGVSSYPGKMNGTVQGNRTRLVSFAENNGAKVPDNDRWLVLGDGNYSSATDQIFPLAAQDQPYGVYKGRLLEKDTKEPAPESWVNIYWYNPDKTDAGKRDLKLFTRISPNEKGEFEALLPMTYEDPKTKDVSGRFAVASGSRSRNYGPSNIGIVVKPGQMTERDAFVGKPAIFKVKVIDSKTKKPIAARVRFEPIPPTPNNLFDEVVSPKGYFDSFYVPPAGTEIELFQGKWALTITGGIRYDYVQSDVTVTWGGETTSEIELPETSPTPGWLGLEIGAMTRATPGASLTDEGIVLMAAGEGVDWIISGDWEKLTDLGPAIAKLGLKDRMGSSRGFRTQLPAHPEWGAFMIYPVAANAPDPRKAREQWSKLETAKDFIATLRKLYPGSLIECVTPYSADEGYFYMPNKNVFEMAYDAREDIDLTIDAVNVFEPRRPWDFQSQKNFYFKNLLRSRFYIPAPVSTTRVALTSEPGYPRMLVKTGESDPTKVKEAELFDAMKKGKWQITTGPFIQYTVDGASEGEMIKGKEKLTADLRITAPNWSSTSIVDVCREGLMNGRVQTNTANNQSARFPVPGGPDSWKHVDLYPKSKNGSDTLLNINLTGTGNASPAIPDYQGRSPVPSMAMTSPIIADTNGNGKWDPPNYVDQGK